MTEKQPIQIEMYYTFTCPNCKLMRRLLDEVLPKFKDRFVLKQKLANSPLGMVRTMKLGIHAVPALVIDGKVIFRSVPSKEELINKLKSYK